MQHTGALMDLSSYLPDTLENMKRTCTWVSVMILVSYVYGDLTVARQLTPDHRQNTWLLMSSPIPTIIFSLLYVATVTWWGPRYMSNRKPVTWLRPFMMAYNVFQVIFCAWIFWEVIYFIFICSFFPRWSEARNYIMHYNQYVILLIWLWYNNLCFRIWVLIEFLRDITRVTSKKRCSRCTQAGMGGWFGSYSFLCQRCDFSSNPQALRVSIQGMAGIWSSVILTIDLYLILINHEISLSGRIWQYIFHNRWHMQVIGTWSQSSSISWIR